MEAKLLYQAIAKDERNALHNAYKLGGVLCKLKVKTPHGQWIPRLKELGISRTSAFEYVQLSKCSEANISSCKSMSEAILQNAISKGEESEDFPATASWMPDRKFCSTPCRKGQGSKDCKACAKLNKTPPANRAPNTQGSVAATEAPPTEPAAEPATPKPNASLEEIMAQAPTYEKLAKSQRILSKKIRKLERSDGHRQITGRKTEQLADAALNISKSLEKTAPKAPCPDCGGVVNLDAEPCKGCKGRAVLTVAEAAALAERVNF